jgi:hypothetical protein
VQTISRIAVAEIAQRPFPSHCEDRLAVGRQARVKSSQDRAVAAKSDNVIGLA